MSGEENARLHTSAARAFEFKFQLGAAGLCVHVMQASQIIDEIRRIVVVLGQNVRLHRAFTLTSAGLRLQVLSTYDQRCARGC